MVGGEKAGDLAADAEAPRAECPVCRGEGRNGDGDCVIDVEEVGSGVKAVVDASEGVALADVDDVGSGVHVVTVVMTASVLSPDVG